MAEFEEVGGDDPRVQATINFLADNFRRSMVSLYHVHPMDVCIAIMSTAFGAATGEMEATRVAHSAECDECAKEDGPNPLNYCELAVKNFEAGFVSGKAGVEAQHQRAAEQADSQLANIFKEHRK